MTQRNRHAIRRACDLSKSIRMHNAILIKLSSTQIDKIKNILCRYSIGKRLFCRNVSVTPLKEHNNNNRGIFLLVIYNCTLLTIARIFQLFAQLYAIFPSERIDCCWHCQQTRYAFYSWKSKSVLLLSQTRVAIAFYTSDMTIVQRIVFNKEISSTHAWAKIKSTTFCFDNFFLK